MKRILLVLVILFCTLGSAFAQGAFNKGDQNIGIGLGVLRGTAIVGQYEYGLTGNIGPGKVGVQGSLQLNIGNGGGYLLGGEINYHLDTVGAKDIDISGGVGYFFNGDGGALGLNATARYYFLPKVGIFGGVNIFFKGDVAQLIVGVKLKL